MILAIVVRVSKARLPVSYSLRNHHTCTPSSTMSSSASQDDSSSQAGSLPDFNRLRQCQEQVEQAQRGYFDEINKLQNVPAFNSDAILAAIERLGRRFDAVEQRLDGVEQRLDGIVGRLDVMDTRQQAAYVLYTPLNNMRIQY